MGYLKMFISMVVLWALFFAVIGFGFKYYLSSLMEYLK
jgi:hypothetical protein